MIKKIASACILYIKKIDNHVHFLGVYFIFLLRIDILV